MKVKKVPMRQCVGCHTSKTKNELIRILKTPENEVMLDTTGRLNGRGAYICPDVECFKKARKSNAFERAFSMKIADSVYEDIERQMLEFDKK